MISLRMFFGVAVAIFGIGFLWRWACSCIVGSLARGWNRFSFGGSLDENAAQPHVPAWAHDPDADDLQQTGDAGNPPPADYARLPFRRSGERETIPLRRTVRDGGGSGFGVLDDDHPEWRMKR